MRVVELWRDAAGAEPALEPALAAALLDDVARGRRGPVLRLYRPPPTVAFGRRDTFLRGFPAAARAARELGFEPVVRAPGGRAAAYDAGCLIIDEVMPEPDAVAGIQERFHQDAERQAAALRGLGVDARVGEVPGEYCPGAFSVNAGGARKLIGAAQRAVRSGWLMSSVVVVERASGRRVREVLEPVYAELGLDWDPATAGAVAGEARAAHRRASLRLEDVEAALLAAYARRYDLRPAPVARDALEAARARIGRHEVTAGLGSDATG